jgi:hypothetical protein
MMKSSGLNLQLSEGNRSARGGGVFICVKNFIASMELWVDDDFKMIPIEVKGVDPKHTWEITGIYRAPNEDMLATERLAACTLPMQNLTKRSITGGDLNLPQADWKGDAEKVSAIQACVNNCLG